MSNSVKFYTIAFELQNKPTNYSVALFFKKLEDILKEREEFIIKRINGEIIRCFEFRHDNSRVIIPLGKVKSKNKPHWLNNGKLEEIPREIFDINSLVYDINDSIMIFTTNMNGPKIQLVEEYFNSFIPVNVPVKIKINPITINKGLERVRNANYVRSINLNLDLGRSLNNFYIKELNNNNEESLLEKIKQLATAARDVGASKTLTLNLGVGHSGKDGTLDLESILSLLHQINLNEDFVKEISVTYKNGDEEKIDKTKLKNATSILCYQFPVSSTNLSSEYLQNNFYLAIREKRKEYSLECKNYFSNSSQLSLIDYNPIKEINYNQIE